MAKKLTMKYLTFPERVDMTHAALDRIPEEQQEMVTAEAERIGMMFRGLGPDSILELIAAVSMWEVQNERK